MPPSLQFPVIRSMDGSPGGLGPNCRPSRIKFLPRAFGVIGIGKQLKIGAVHRTFLNQPFEVDDTRPI